MRHESSLVPLFLLRGAGLARGADGVVGYGSGSDKARRKRVRASADNEGPASGALAAPWRINANWASTRRHTAQMPR